MTSNVLHDDFGDPGGPRLVRLHGTPPANPARVLTPEEARLASTALLMLTTAFATTVLACSTVAISIVFAVAATAVALGAA